ncbi:hypothetical protein POSPLADRAFT_1154498 [Postia placenta MAD-698-R-SB12]|uniref:Uncharacterized protein n=1 Tax=Postia placenta MAD-698-R-SB12 TaxID=670580 RepID=A0A1X6MPK9_9APHY|nr:hypothetical protein POSPLADRAFT_1154498 [Postia placenta MAD-698-R-SB12]OSX58341.1 hypothetical protein POSPLADRAFT_1154498 [Postia placenta MAD-698-R-SB12]
MIRQLYETAFLRLEPASFHYCGGLVIRTAVTFSVVLALCADHPSLWNIVGFQRLGTFDIVLGSIYAATCGMCLFGVIAVSLQRLWMAWLYARLSVVSALAITGTDLFRVINELLDECAKIAQSKTVIKWILTMAKLGLSEATTNCRNKWSYGSTLEIITLIFVAIGVSCHSLLVFAWSNELHEAAMWARLMRPLATKPPRPSGGEDAHPAHDKPPLPAYNARQCAQPHGAPPAYDGHDDSDDVKLYNDAKPPLYSEDDLEMLEKQETYSDVVGPDPSEDLEGNYGYKDVMK